MDLTPDAIVQVIHPTAAFTTLTSPPQPPNEESPAVDWAHSRLNPLTRIDSLTPVIRPKWRIDGCCGMGTQFFTIPISDSIPGPSTSSPSPLPPLRIDTFIPPPSEHTPELQHLLGLNRAFSYRDTRVLRLGIAQHILRALEYYTGERGEAWFDEEYRTLPFGSRIIFEELHKDVKKCRITIMRNTQLEHQLLSLSSLARLVPAIPAASWPDTVDISSLRFERQLHDSVCVVMLSDPTGGSQLLILKALTSDPKYIYHEIVSLLLLPPHPNIIRPAYLVTKKCGFGGKTGVVGMLIPYHRAGSLRDIIPRRALEGTLRPDDQVRWAKQLTAVMEHVRAQGGYYSDMRLDNVVLSDTGDAVLVDFEQRGVWASFAAPEVACLDYMATLAMSADGEIPAERRDEFRGKMDRYVPGWEEVVGRGVYTGEADGYALGWLGMEGEEREAAMVYMLGRALWCIFEGVSMPERAVWRTCQFEGDLEFPRYRRTPTPVQELIDRCTIGRVDVRRESGVVREGGRIVLRGGKGTETAEMVRRSAREWWREEVERAERFLGEREDRRERGEASVFCGRPRLREVFAWLESWGV